MAVLTFVHDPLCGWCYGASPLVRALREAALPGLTLRLLHRALFTGMNAHPHTGGFPAYAWSSDQRIAKLAGVPFSEAYKRRILDDPDKVHDSWPTALAKQAVDRLAPGKAVDWFLAVGEARFLHGEDVRDKAVLARVAGALGVEKKAFEGALADPGVAEAAEKEAGTAARLCATLGRGGVPLFLLADGNRQARPVAHEPHLPDPMGFVSDVRNGLTRAQT